MKSGKRQHLRFAICNLHIVMLCSFWVIDGGLQRGAAQNIAINSTGNLPNASAGLDVDYTNAGFLVPRMTAVQRTAMNPLPQAAQGLLVYQTDPTEGFYYNISTTTTPDWKLLSSGSATGWQLTGNNSTVSGTNFIGTTDAQAFDIRTDNTLRVRITTQGKIGTFNTGQSVFVGEGAGNSDDLTANQNTFVGYQAGYNTTIGTGNVALGHSAIFSNVLGSGNTAIGSQSLYSNTAGGNTAVGYMSLYFNIAGTGNTAVGDRALYNYLGDGNTASGFQALYTNSAGTGNTSTGSQSLYFNTGNDNTAHGYQSLYWNTAGGNTAIGYWTLFSNTGGTGNCAVGFNTLYSNLTGNYNTACGTGNTPTGGTLYQNTTGTGNVAFGRDALNYCTTGNYNTAFGYNAIYTAVAYTLSNTTAIGNNPPDPTVDNQVRIGATTVSSIGGQVGWTNLSDGRLKKNISETVPGLAFIAKLRPVTYYFDYDKMAAFFQTPDTMRLREAEAAAGAIFQTGFIAQEVEKAAREIGFDFSGVDVDKPMNDNSYYGLRYGEFTPVLVKAVQEQQKMIEENKKEIEKLKAILTKITAGN